MPNDPSFAAAVTEVAGAIAGRMCSGRPMVAGISGAQGAGKTTLTAHVAARLEQQGLRAITLALDDFYLPKAARAALAGSIHPLCAVRGVPGTHDIGELAATLDALAGAHADTRTPVPLFSKLDDDRMPEQRWPIVVGRPDVVLLEGWCIGACAIADRALERPINALERDEDPDGRWRRWWNGCLARDYEPLWRRLDLLALILLPGIDSVIEARLRQERDLARKTARAPALDRAGVVRFVAHYERLTRHIWAEMPSRADIVLARDDNFRFRVLKPRQT